MDWQNIIAISIVAAAALYLGRQAWLIVRRKRTGGCGACSSCPSDGEQTAEGKPLVTIGQVGDARGTPRR